MQAVDRCFYPYPNADVAVFHAAHQLPTFVSNYYRAAFITLFAENVTMLTIVEWMRCAKHNIWDRPGFKVGYRRGLYQVTTSDGVKLRFPHNPFLPFYEIGGYLAQGKWSITPGMFVIDAGAFLGEFALYAAAKVGPTGKVFMMEPDPTCISRLDDIFKINGGKPANLIFVKQGLWKEPGALEFRAGAEGGSAVSLVKKVSDSLSDKSRHLMMSARVMSISVQSLAGLVEAYDIHRLDFIKMDIEGAEVEVIESAGDIMKRFSPKFAIASYHMRDGRRTSDLLEPLFAVAGYKSSVGFPSHLTTYASRDSVP